MLSHWARVHREEEARPPGFPADRDAGAAGLRSGVLRVASCSQPPRSSSFPEPSLYSSRSLSLATKSLKVPVHGRVALCPQGSVGNDRCVWSLPSHSGPNPRGQLDEAWAPSKYDPSATLISSASRMYPNPAPPSPPLHGDKGSVCPAHLCSGWCAQALSNH